MILRGDCIERMRELDEASVDAVVCDPPYELGFMSKAWDRSGVAYRVETWLEALRILKPGGHLLAFGGTRTYHRLACAVEDAGFEIRDSLIWIYGSGFPKSLDVSKAIDKAAGVEREVERVATRAGNAERRGEGDQGATFGDTHGGFTTLSEPATPEARQWEGWGTALKPAHEPVVVARKPLSAGGVSVRVNVENGLRDQGVTGDIKWTKRPVSGAERLDHSESSSSTPQQSTVGVSVGPADASATARHELPTANDSAPSKQRGARPTENAPAATAASPAENSARKSSTPTEGSANAAGKRSATSSPSTTSTEAEPPTAGKSGRTSAESSSAKDSPRATESFAGIATGLTGSRAVARISKLSDGTFAWPDELPERVAGGSTVAATVLEHGTGALNVDGCRVGVNGGGTHCDNRNEDGRCRGHKNAGRSTSGETFHGPEAEDDVGRWPANLTLSPEAAEELDRQSGNIKTNHIEKPCPDPEIRGERWGTIQGDRGARGYDDEGGASRFFYTAKASRGERNAGLDGGRSSHPTVKPIDLMRWLVRLVTPPGGTVLDPFLGSGTTGIAAHLEGFDFIGIEREDEYANIAEARIKWWSQFPAGTEVEDALGIETVDRRVRDSGQASLWEAA